MSFPEWLKLGWLRPHRTSRDEVAGLRAVIERDLRTSGDPNLDGDWRFAIAYNAALQSAVLALKVSGYEVPKGGGSHHHTIESLKLTLADDGTAVRALQAFRAKRSGGIYETTGIASNSEVEELRKLATSLHKRVLEWIHANHKQLLGEHHKTGKPRRRRSDS
jgi:hypothetical protein